MRLSVILVLVLIHSCGCAEPAWRSVLTDKPRAEERAEPTAAAPDVLALDVASAGGSRLLWRVRFAEPFERQDTVLIIYLDTDCDESTGRAGLPVQGTDRMLAVVDGELNTSSHSSSGGGRRSRVSISGDAVTITDDLDILVGRIRAAREPFAFSFRARVLCHKGSNPADADDTPWFAASVQIDPFKLRDRDPGEPIPKIEHLRTQRTAEGAFRIMFTTTESVLARVTGPGQPLCETDGFGTNHAWTASSPGRFRIALYDEMGVEIASREFFFSDRSRKPAERKALARVILYLDHDRSLVGSTPAAVDPVRWPVAGGVPLAQGELFSPDRARLLDGSGVERIIQTEVAARWPDGSIRWLLVELVAELPADLAERFVLEYGRGVVRRALGPMERAAAITADSVARPCGGSAVRFVVSKPETVECDGPVRRTTLMQGRYGDSPFGCRMRVHSYAGLQIARIEHTLTVDGGDPMARLASLTVSFPGEGAVAAVRNREENWPCEVAAEGGTRVLRLLPELKPDEYANRPEPREILYYWFDEGCYKLRVGMHKTHEILVARGDTPNWDSLAFWLDNPPVPRAMPEYVCSTGAAGPLEPRSQTVLPKYEERIRTAFAAVEKLRRDRKEFGFLNFGDWYGERGRNWGNLEYDLTHALWLEWLRSGDYSFYRRADEAARHQADIDMVHADRDPANVGRVWGHSMGHTGGYFPDGTFGMETFSTRGFWDTGHTWCEGLLHMYLATGRRRFLENGLLVADQLARYETTNFAMRCERNAGWPIISLVAAYEVTGDAFYLNGASVIARKAMNRQDPVRGGWFFRIGECKHVPAHVGGKTFMSGLLATGLSRLHRVLPEMSKEDREFKRGVAHSLVRGCDWMLAEAWIPNRNGFFYAQCPTFEGKACRAAPWMVCEALAYASLISGDAKYVDVATRALDCALRIPQSAIGKHLAMEMRSTPHFLAMVSQSRELARARMARDGFCIGLYDGGEGCDRLRLSNGHIPPRP